MGLVSRGVEALAQMDGWGAGAVAVAVLRGGEVVARRGAREREFRWASITKPAVALATLVAAEEGVVDLDEPAGPEGSTVRHLLAHASGLPFDGDEADRDARARGASTRTRASSSSPGTSSAPRRCRSRSTCAQAVFAAAGDGRGASRLGRRGRLRHARRPGRARARAAVADARRAGDARRDDVGAVRRA